MATWAKRPPRIATYALAACAGAVVWLLLAAGSASAEERARPAGDLGQPGSVAADLRSAPSPLGERGSAAPHDRSAGSGPEGPSLERTVGAVGDVVVPEQREASRSVDRVVDAVPSGDRAVEAVTDQVDRTTDAAVASVKTVARTVDAAVTEPVVRPVLDQHPNTPATDPRAVRREPAATSPHRADRADAREDASGAGNQDARAVASRLGATLRLDPARSVPVPRPDAVAEVVAAELGAAIARVLDRPTARPEAGQPGTGDAAGTVASADGGGGALAVLDGRACDLADAGSHHALPGRDAPQGPAFAPAFSPD